jgi:integrase
MFGLRRGELAGLQWGDVDVAAQVLVVSRQVRREPGGRLAVVRPKSEASNRVVALDRASLAVRAGCVSSGSRQAAASNRPHSCFPATGTGPSTRTGSPGYSAGSTPPRDCRRFGCTICATARPAWRWRPAMI